MAASHFCRCCEAIETSRLTILLSGYPTGTWRWRFIMYKVIARRIDATALSFFKYKTNLAAPHAAFAGHGAIGLSCSYLTEWLRT